MSEERRRLLGIPIHEKENDHAYVDGYCTCGQEQPKAGRKVKSFSMPPRQAPKTNLDIIERNWSEM